jgi:uridine phosphorylase
MCRMQIFEVGLAGGVQPYLKPGDIVVVTEAIHDEGTSHNYLPPETKKMKWSHLHGTGIAGAYKICTRKVTMELLPRQSTSPFCFS